MRRIFVPLFILFIAVSCQREPVTYPNPTSDYSNLPVLAWTRQLDALIRNTPGYISPVAARSAAFIGIAMYESAVPGMPEYRSLKGQVKGLENLPAASLDRQYHWGIAVNAAAAATVLSFFQGAPAQMLAQTAALEESLLQEMRAGVAEDVVLRSIGWGKRIAEVVLAMEASDPAGHAAYYNNYQPGYQLPATEGTWSPTPPLFHPPLAPYWSGVRPILASVQAVHAAAPPGFSTDPSSPVYNEALELVSFGELNEDQKHMAEFWNDPSPGLTMGPAFRWLAIAAQVLRDKSANLDKSVETFAKVSIALADAGVSCWSAKYTYHTMRPVTYIQAAIDPAYQEYLPSASSPEYTSEHAMFGSAAAEVLNELFGKNYSFTDRCHEGRTEFRSTPRSYKGFHAAAEESAYSRMYAGNHFRHSCSEGLRVGKIIGQHVLYRINWTY